MFKSQFIIRLRIHIHLHMKLKELTETQPGVQIRYKSFDCKSDVASLLAVCCLLAPR
jgi:hypothetical protein